ncbi:MAG: A24 family peptidase [Clostridium sp.]
MNEYIKFIPAIAIVILVLIGMYTDIKRFEIEHWVSIIGAVICIAAAYFKLIPHNIYSISISPFEVIKIPMTVLPSIISGILIFVAFLFIPVGGGDMKVIAFLACYFGVVETIGIFILASIIVFIYGMFTYQSYIDANPELFKKTRTKQQRWMKAMRRKVPMMIGIAPATIIALGLVFFM